MFVPGCWSLPVRSQGLPVAHVPGLAGHWCGLARVQRLAPAPDQVCPPERLALAAGRQSVLAAAPAGWVACWPATGRRRSAPPPVTLLPRLRALPRWRTAPALRPRFGPALLSVLSRHRRPGQRFRLHPLSLPGSPRTDCPPAPAQQAETWLAAPAPFDSNRPLASTFLCWQA